MNDISIEKIASNFEKVKINLSKEEIAKLFQDNNVSNDEIEHLLSLSDYLVEKQRQTVINFCLKISRLPLKEIKDFESFDFTRLKGKDINVLKNLDTLSTLYSRSNLAFIGPQGIGKTHLAMAFGRKCCEKGLKVYFLKASELNDKISEALKYNRLPRLITDLVKPTCLIVDEVGRSVFSKENTRIFFDIVDRRYNKDGPNCMIFTSNKDPANWGEFFDEDDSLLCSLDRIFDNALVFMMKGDSYRGKKLRTVALETVNVVTKDTTKDNL